MPKEKIPDNAPQTKPAPPGFDVRTQRHRHLFDRMIAPVVAGSIDTQPPHVHFDKTDCGFMLETGCFPAWTMTVGAGTG
jgi:hypothetical protein